MRLINEERTMTLVITRQLTPGTYDSDTSCPKGHTLRYKSNDTCAVCNRERNRTGGTEEKKLRRELAATRKALRAANKEIEAFKVYAANKDRRIDTLKKLLDEALEKAAAAVSPAE